MNRKQLAATCTFITLILSGCVTNSDATVTKTKVIDRTPGVDATPEWTRGKKKFSAPDQRIGFVGFLQMEPDSNPGNCVHAAGTEGKGRIAALIAATVMDEAGITGDEKNVAINRMTAILSRTKIANVEIGDEYWAVVEKDDGDNPPVRHLECYSQITIPAKVLKTLLDHSMAEIMADPELKKLKNKIDKGEEKLEGGG